MRKDPLIIGEIYHIFNKSIAGYQIFNSESESLRIIEAIRYYQNKNTHLKFSKLINSSNIQYKHPQSDKTLFNFNNKEKLVEIIAYCVMPTHLHLILKQLEENGISTFMSNLLNSYTRYFNTKHMRKGPLWVGRFKNVLVRTDEQLLHLTRYIHLNPVTACLTHKPEDWPASSYKEYLLEVKDSRFCKYDDVLDIEPNSYRKFTEDRISYQRELSKISKLLFD